MKRPSQNDQILELLSGGQWVGHHRLYAIGCVAHSRISELRRRGYEIEHRLLVNCQREQIHEYRLVGGVTEGGAARELLGSGIVCSDLPSPGAPSVTSSPDQPGQPLIPIPRANVCGNAPAGHFHADSQERLFAA